MRRQIASQKGAAMVEFAIVLTLLLILAFGIIEFGVILYNQQVLTNAAREGARQGIVSRPTTRVTSSEIQLDVMKYLRPPTGAAPSSWRLITFNTVPNPTITTPSVCTSIAYVPTEYVEVHVTLPTPYLVIGNLIPGLPNITLTSDAIMKCE